MKKNALVGWTAVLMVSLLIPVGSSFASPPHLPAAQQILQVNLGRQDSQRDAIDASLLVGTPVGEGPDQDLDPSPERDLPFFISSRGLSVLAAAAIVLVVLLGAGLGFLILRRQRRAEGSDLSPTDQLS